MRIQMIKRITACFMIISLILLGSINLDAVSAEMSESADKEYCYATIEDNFADDKVLVVLNNEASLACQSLTVGDFSEINAKAVRSLSTALEKRVKSAIDNALAAAAKGVMAEIDTGLNMSTFNSILCIDLTETGKDKVLESVKILERMDHVLYAGPDYYGEFCSSSSYNAYVEEFADQWAATTIKLNEAWNYLDDNSYSDTNINVAVIDSGIKGNHSALQDKISSEGHNNYVSGNQGALEDLYNHGTKVAGIICGVSENVTLYSMKVGDDGYVSSSDVCDALDDVRTMDEHISIVNLSVAWQVPKNGGLDRYDEPVKHAIEQFDGLVVSAAGNQGVDIDNDASTDYYPAEIDLPNLIVVGASDEDDYILDNSNYGMDSVDIFAPGEEIYTTSATGGYTTTEFTSFAAPFVTGVAALLLRVNPNFDAQDLIELITENADKVESLEDYCTDGRRLNAYAAVQAARNFCSEHNWITTHTVSGHVERCSTCRRQRISSDTLYVSSISSNSITVKCSVSDCTLDDITCSHTLSYESVDDTCHRIKCSTCKFGVNYQHSYSDYELSVEFDGHTATCSDCGHFAELKHDWKFEDTSGTMRFISCSKCFIWKTCSDELEITYNDYQHHYYCSSCDYLISEDHDMSEYLYVDNADHAISCSGCSYSYVDIHDHYLIDYYDITATLGCNICGHIFFCNHEPEYGNDEYDHVLACYDCRYEIREAHSMTVYSQTSSASVHTVYCSTCGYAESEAHNFSDYENTGSSSTHSANCLACSYTKSVSHTFAYILANNDLNHRVYCSICGYWEFESHTWVLKSGIYKCMYCGQISSSTPSNPIASIPPRNDEELSE